MAFLLPFCGNFFLFAVMSPHRRSAQTAFGAVPALERLCGCLVEPRRELGAQRGSLREPSAPKIGCA